MSVKESYSRQDVQMIVEDRLQKLFDSVRTVQIVEPNPGDVVVFNMADHASIEEMEGFARVLNRVFPNNKVVIAKKIDHITKIANQEPVSEEEDV